MGGRMSIADNLQRVRERIAEAAGRAGRRPEEVTLVAVTKTHPPEVALEAVRAGALDLGENYAQELVAKKEALEAAGVQGVRWHFIGHLQRNKVKYIAPFIHLIHSVDSLRLGQEISKRAQQAGRRIPVLIEVNVSGEETKFGVPPEQVRELAEGLLELEGVELQGLMTMAPIAEDPEQVRPIYRRLRELAEELAASGLPEQSMRHLSMGMTQDFEVAVEEGATIVRVGTAIFGPRRQG